MAILLLAFLSNAPHRTAQDHHDAAESTSSNRIKAMTFNIRFDNPADGPNAWPNRRTFVHQIVSEDWDVIGLQEVLAHQLTDILKANPRYASIGVGRDDGVLAGELSPILYDRERFAVARSGTLWLSETPEAVASISWDNVITRICTWAQLIDLRSQEVVWVYNTHWDHVGSQSRLESAKLISDRIRSQTGGSSRIILMGDFNTGEESAPMRWIMEGGDGRPEFRHAFRAVHPETEQVGTFNAWRGKADGAMIDSVLVPVGTTVIDAGINRWNEEGRYPSDHFPVWAEVEWKGS